MTRRAVLVVQHDHASPLGPVAERLEQRRCRLTTHLVVPAERFTSPGVVTDFPDFTAYDAVVLMAAPWSETTRRSPRGSSPSVR